MRYRLAVFDFDGTIVDTRLPITLSVNRALGEFGFGQRPVADIEELIGLPLPVVLGTLAGSEADVDALCERYRAVFKEVAPEAAPMYEGVRGALAALREAGVTLAIATSRSRESLEKFLDQHLLRGDFAFWAGGSCVERGKPNPDMLEHVVGSCGHRMADTIMIGDTSHDMEMGHAAGADTLAVSYGMHALERLRSAEPTHLVHHAREIPGVVLSPA